LLSCFPGGEGGKTDNNDPKETPSRKRDHAYAYIKGVVDSEIVDRSAYAGQDKTLYLPYRKLRFFYGEYEHNCRELKIDSNLYGKESTFRRAFNALLKDYAKAGIPVKFSEGRGTIYMCVAKSYVDFMITFHVLMMDVAFRFV
jgi:hypothetical protein